MIIRQSGSVAAVGNLTRDPEQKASSSGKTPPVKASIAIGSGDKVQFLNLVAWYERGEDLMEGRKGDKVVVFGTEKDASYTNRNEERVEKTEVDCEVVIVFPKTGNTTSKPKASPPPPPPDMQETNEDMPF